MNEKIKRRIEQKTGIPGLVDILSERLSPGDLQSLLLEVSSRKAGAVTPQSLLQRYSSSRFTKLSAVNPRELAQLLADILGQLPDEFEALELAPLAPLGTCSAVASVHQNKIVSTVRNLELSSDPTGILALESAVRRRHGSAVHLAAAQRVVRAQHFGENPNLVAHFSLLALSSADRWSRDFEQNALSKHLTFYAQILGTHYPGRELSFAVTPLSTGGERLFEAISGLGPLVLDSERTSGRGYYEKLCFKVNLDGVEFGDGGFTNWTQQLLSDGKECLLTSGISLERMASAD